jgi:glycosyltransferase involved in cell wall biosynthesis
MSNLVIHTEASRGWGGQETRVLTELKWLKSAGYRPLLVAPSDSEIFARAGQMGVECRAFEFSKWGQPMDFFKLYQIFKQLKPRVVATHSTIDSRIGLMAAKLAGVPIKLRYRHVSVPVTRTPLNRFIYGYCADKIITTADFISRDLSRTLRLDATRFCTIATGIEPPSQMPDREEARLGLAREISLAADSRFLGIVAVLRSWKGHLYLLDAFEHLAPSFPNYHLVLVGDGPMKDLHSALRKDQSGRGAEIWRLIAQALISQNFDALREFHWNALFIGTMHFMDNYNYDTERVSRCCIHYATPDGRIIPFCAYNSGPVYREQVWRKFALPAGEPAPAGTGEAPLVPQEP